MDPEPRSPGPPVFLSARPEEAHRGLWTQRECPRDDILEAELRSEPPGTGSRLAGNGGPRALLLLTTLADRACHLAPWFRSLIVSKKQSVKMPPDLANVIEGQRGAPAAHRRRRPPPRIPGSRQPRQPGRRHTEKRRTREGMSHHQPRSSADGGWGWLYVKCLWCETRRNRPRRAPLSSREPTVAVRPLRGGCRAAW